MTRLTRHSEIARERFSRSYMCQLGRLNAESLETPHEAKVDTTETLPSTAICSFGLHFESPL